MNFGIFRFYPKISHGFANIFQNHMPLTPALRRQRQADLCEFKTSLVYKVSFRTGPKTTEKPCLGGKKENC